MAIVVTVVSVSAAIAGSMQWQLIDGGQPIRGWPVALDYISDAGCTFSSIGDGYMPPVFWRFVAGTWQRRQFSTLPTAVSGWSSAYDSNRKVLVRFGGSTRGDQLINETWEFDGASWVQRNISGAPSPRGGAAMAYDSARHVVVMFGGQGVSALLNDTWEYDGVQWRQIATPTPRPVARYVSSMAYDANRGKTVMAFGLASTPLKDTWEYDGTKWTQAPQPPPSFPSRYFVPISYDPIRKKVFIFSGLGVGAETRYWTGTQWQLVTTPTAPVARSHAAMTFDATLGKSLLYGGEDQSGALLADTWTFDGTNWQQSNLPESLAARSYSASSFDQSVQAPISQGGSSCCFPTALHTDDTRRWNGSSWGADNPSVRPDPRDAHAAAYDPTSGATVMFGGWDVAAAGCVEETWEYVAATQVWTLVPAFGPKARCYIAMTYSESHGGVVLIGGESQNGADPQDVWVYSNGSWTRILQSGGPGVRVRSAIDYDSLRQQIVLYGGFGGGDRADTWTLRGTTWTQIVTSGPGLRADHAMAFDPIRGVSILVGGATEPNYDQRTWEFEGTNWTGVTTVYTPDMLRWGGSALWDPVHQVVLFFGGSPDRVNGLYTDTWAYGWDADDDLIVGLYDNCPNVPNADQTNSDTDSAGNACDCAPNDPTTIAIPAEVSGVAISNLSGVTRVAWTDLAAQAGTSVRYDLATGPLTFAMTPFAGASCLANNVTSLWFDDAASTPSPGSGVWYLVRAETSCGKGTFGANRSALEGTTVCP